MYHMDDKQVSGTCTATDRTEYLYFHISAVQNMCAVPNMAVFCIS